MRGFGHILFTILSFYVSFHSLLKSLTKSALLMSLCVDQWFSARHEFVPWEHSSRSGDTVGAQRCGNQGCAKHPVTHGESSHNRELADSKCQQSHC